MRPSARTTLLLAASAALVAFCSPTAADGANVPAGEWNGQHIALSVTASGATVEFDCAHGTINGTLTLDANNHFAVNGTFVREHGGPTREDEASKGVPASYTGTLKDDTLTVTVELTDSKESVGVFTLTRGGAGRLFKCR
jgi:hypothetical protein